MKKTLSLLVAVVLVLGMMSMGISANLGKSYTAPYGTPVVDGTVDPVWDAAAWTEIDLPYDGNPDKTVFSARAKLLHDDNLVYVLVEATDATLDPDGDCFEIYFDEDACKDVAYCEVSTQLQLRYDGTITKGTNSIGDIDMVKDYIITTSENGFLLEFSIALMNGIPAPDKAIGLEFMANNNDEDGAFIDALRWNVDTANGDTPPYIAVDNFGDLFFAAYVEPVVDEPAADEPTVDAPAADTTPVTADAGIVVAAVVMAAAAAVVLKKH